VWFPYFFEMQKLRSERERKNRVKMQEQYYRQQRVMFVLLTIDKRRGIFRFWFFFIGYCPRGENKNSEHVYIIYIIQEYILIA